MKVTFLNNVPDEIDRPFAIYGHNEGLSGSLNYIDIRGIVHGKTQEWLNEISESYAVLSGKFLGYTRWWWVTGMSRLDARPWGQEHLFKPLFFARAVLEWQVRHYDIKEIFLIGCPQEVAIYLKEFKKDLLIENEKEKVRPILFLSFLSRHLLFAVLKSAKNAVHIIRYHLFRKSSFIKGDMLVLYELVANISVTDSYKYYYDGLFDSPQVIKNISVAHGCIDSVFSPVKKLKSEKSDKTFFLLDSISFVGLLKSIFLSLYLIFLTGWVSLRKNSCKFGDYDSSYFWPNYLLNELSRTVSLNSICCYCALGNIFKAHKYRCVISTYEEKIVERAILFACKEAGIPAVGYIPHPQHYLTLALRDTYKPYSPKPQRYAVCGQKYVDYFLSQCNKKPDSVSIWGSKKSSEEVFAIKKFSRDDLKVLMLISHPNELSVFSSWLRSEPRLSCGVRYFLRIYKAVNYKKFSTEVKIITSSFNFVKEANGDFRKDLDLCDLAAFCATSAGLVAVNYGRISIHLSLDDFFRINPCFDDLSAMLSCDCAAKFADLLERIRSMDNNAVSELYRKQRNFVDQVFSPIQAQNIEREISRACLN